MSASSSRRLGVARRRRQGLRLVAVPALDAPSTLLEHRHRARRELVHAFVERQRRRRVAVAQEQVEGGRVERRALRQRGQHRAQLGAEDDRAVVDAVVDELDAGRIARQHEAARAFVPDRQAEHAVQVVEHRAAPLLVAVDDDLGVGARAELVAQPFEFAPQLGEVVDLAVEHDPHRLLHVGHRLVAAGQVDDRQAAKAQAERARVVEALVVGPAVGDRLRHRGHGGA